MSSQAQTLPASRPALSVPSVLLVFLLLAAASYGALIWAPTERTMGIVQRIFYFHVASAWSGFISFLLVFIGSALTAAGGLIAYMALNSSKYELLAGTILVDGQPSTKIKENSLVKCNSKIPALLRLADGSSLELAPASEAAIMPPIASTCSRVEPTAPRFL
jgi:hypothetical protein